MIQVWKKMLSRTVIQQARPLSITSTSSRARVSLNLPLPITCLSTLNTATFGTSHDASIHGRNTYPEGVVRQYTTASTSTSFFQPDRYLLNIQEYGNNRMNLKSALIRNTSSLRNNNNTSNDLNILSIRRPEKGTGFDNFIPKQEEDSNETNADKNEKGSEEKSSKKNKNESKNSNKNNNNGYNGILTFAALVALLYYLESGDAETTEHDPTITNGKQQQQWGREISWHDFLRLLQQRDIIKVVVTDERKMARVFVKPNAVGLGSRYNSTLDFDTSQQQGGQKEHVDASNSDLSHVDRIEGFNSHRNNGLVPGGGNGMLEPMFPYYRINIGSVDSFERKLEDAQRALYGNESTHDVPIQYTPDNTIGREMLGIVPGLLMAGMMFALMRFASGGGLPGSSGSGGIGGRGGMGGIFQIGKSTAKKINKEDVTVTFADVAGCEEAKKEIMEFVDFLKESERFTKLGAKIPKGALLCGPPGTGKTLLAKAVAGEAGVPFYSISGSDFIEMFVGVGPSRVRDLFQEARSNAPCIVFIDEIDAVGRQRGRGGVGGNDERENTLNQLLVEMDGFSPSTGVVVLAGTNRVDILDNALTRAGRFDRQIMVDKPDLKGRQAIFKVHLKGIKLEDDIDDIAGRLAGLTPGFAGADIANICNEAAIVAARRKGEKVTVQDFEKATDRIIGGLESNKIMSKEERSIVAHHEAGHAVAGWFLEHADPLMKVTIIPRSSGALGFAQYLPKEVFLRTEEQIMDIVCMALAGRAAEEIFFGEVTNGASDDLKRVTKLVYSTIQLYGMNHRLGQLSFPKDPNAMFDDRPYSEKTAKAMDEEAKIIVDQAYQRTLQLLKDKKHELSSVANMLLQKETITHEDILNVIGPRPFKGDKLYEDFLMTRRKDKSKSDENKADDDGVAPPKTKDDESGSSPPGLNPAF